MAVPQEMLERLGKTLRIVRIDPPLAQLGQYVRFTIGPDPGLLRAVDVDGVVSNLSLLLDAAMRGQARSSPAGIGAAFKDPADIPIGTMEGSLGEVTQTIDTVVEGINPGSVARIAGSMPIPVQVPVNIAVTWRAYRYVWVAVSSDAGPWRGPRGPVVFGSGTAGAADTIVRTILDAEAVMGGTALDVDAALGVHRVRQDLAAGEDFVAPDGVNAADVAFLFAPAFVELTMRPPGVQDIYVEAEVTLSVPGQPAHKVDLGPVKVLLPVVPIPKLLALFRYPQFNLDTEGGVPRKGPAVLLVVPADSPLGAIGELRPILSTLRTVLTPLRSIRRFLRLLTGISLLESALSRRPRVRFAVADGIADLHVIKLIKNASWQDPWVNDQIPDIRGWPGDDDDNDLYAGGRMSSLIFLGPPEATVECYVAKYFNEEPDDVPPILRDANYYANGRLVVTIGEEAVVTISSLSYREGETVPVTVPAGRAYVDRPPDPSDGGFDDRISSVRF